MAIPIERLAIRHIRCVDPRLRETAHMSELTLLLTDVVSDLLLRPPRHDVPPVSYLRYAERSRVPNLPSPNIFQELVRRSDTLRWFGRSPHNPLWSAAVRRRNRASWCG